MRVGTIVKLKVECLGNKQGALGVVFNDYGDGSQVIFENGKYDGFAEINEVERFKGQTEKDYFLEEVGFADSLAGYQFQNVMQVSEDYDKGIFNAVLRTGK
jgi:hypothetical protein